MLMFEVDKAFAVVSMLAHRKELGNTLREQ